MALIIDPDNLSQGAENVVGDLAFTSSAGAVTTITGSASLPAIAAGEYFAIRDSSVAGNNGLYLETGGSPTTSSITATKQTGPNPTDLAAESTSVFGTTGASTELSVFFYGDGERIWLVEQGNLSSDGVTGQALYSFIKEEWKTDATLIPFPFPMIAITSEQFEFINDWELNSDAMRKLVRTAGWAEVDNNGNNKRELVGVITLGTFEDSGADTAYYASGDDPTDTTGNHTTDFTYAGPVNEAIEVFEETIGPAASLNFNSSSQLTRSAGSWITDGYRVGGNVTIRDAEDVGNNGTFDITALSATVITVSGTPFTTNADDETAVVAYNNKDAIKLFLRVRDGDPTGKLYDQASLADIGVTELTYQAYRFPLSNASDLKITETDANISTNTPYTEVRIRYLSGTYNREVDTTTKRNFGIVIDVGTYSRDNGASAASTLFTSANHTLGAGEALSDYTNGTLIIHEGTDQGSYTVSGTPVDNAGTLEITLSSSLTASESNLSFTLQRATPVTATAEEIYEKVQYQLRQSSDIDETGNTVSGETADELLNFVGDTLKTGLATPTNPNGGGSGVIIEGFDSNDTNRLTFTDNGGTERTYPFVAAGTISFNTNLSADTGSPQYWMFFTYTERFTNTGFGLSSPSADTATLDSSVTDLTAELSSGDYITLAGFSNSELDGIYVLTGAPAGGGPYTAAVRRVDGTTLAAEAAGASVSLDKNPINTPDAIIVDNNSGADIAGTISGGSVAFDFDYDGNVQGGRTAGTDADITLRALGLDTGQFTETTGTITRNTGLSFSLVAGLERNYSNP